MTASPTILAPTTQTSSSVTVTSPMLGGADLALISHCVRRHPGGLTGIPFAGGLAWRPAALPDSVTTGNRADT